MEAGSHLHELTRYIHLNPVRAGMVEHPADYQWSSYRDSLGLRQAPAWLDVTATLSRFGTTEAKQRQQYREFVERPEEVAQDPLRELQFGAV
ncbi:MAG: addiction module toxin RelE, partial [Armatimonadetes bacterium]|nr:addiction module toxin RelE [Armatimonadota bacterium]